MNYRHIYHAGNFADVLKHAVLARVVCYMRRKEKPFRCIDTHAGPGLYDLSAEQARKTGEWRTGIGRLLETEITGPARELLEPYLNAVRSLNPTDLRLYPGSPKLMRLLLRRQDRLSAIELHPQDCAMLRRLFKGDVQSRVIELDGWLALGAHVPPRERRGLVLVDPPFEQVGEFDRLADGLARANRRWTSGTYLLWYPIKADAPIRTFHNRLRALDIGKMLCAELSVMHPDETTGLAGSGLVVVNPPYTLYQELRTLLPVLCELLSQSPRAKQRVLWLAGSDES